MLNRATTAMDQMLERRFVVNGTSGAGKTTIARRISQILRIPHVELDALHWGPHWQPVALREFQNRTVAATAGNAWVVDGNYSKVRDIVWSRASDLVWLDYSYPLVLWRVTRRTLRRVAQQQELWSGNRETVGKAFFSRKSIIWWALTTHFRRRREIQALLREPRYRHLVQHRLKTDRQTSRWLAALSTLNDKNT